MPRFFFHVFDHGVSHPDIEGTELHDIHVAQSEAVHMAGQVMRDLAAHFWNDGDWRVEIANAKGLTLFIVGFSAEEVAPA